MGSSDNVDEEMELVMSERFVLVRGCVQWANSISVMRKSEYDWMMKFLGVHFQNVEEEGYELVIEIEGDEEVVFYNYLEILDVIDCEDISEEDSVVLSKYVFGQCTIDKIVRVVCEEYELNELEAYGVPDEYIKVIVKGRYEQNDRYLQYEQE